MKNIVLTGLSGCGKTTLGRRLAQKLGLRFVDMDSVVCEWTGLAVADIFAGYGEGFFREVEARVARHLGQKQGLVISTGGGAVLRDDNVQALRDNSYVIFIDRPIDAIEKDIDYAGRPLLADAEKLRQMERQRRPRYLTTADFVVENRNGRTGALEKLVAASLPLVREGYAVIGSPIGHSLSPLLHRALFGAQGIDQDYGAVLVPKEALAGFLQGVRAGGMKGFNVTLPCKTAIIPLLDEVDPEAALCGAVNTVVKRDGRLCGYNTDMEGLHRALKRAGSGYAGKRVLLLGAGGAARGVALKAVLEGARVVHIRARNTEKAAELARSMARQGESVVSAGGLAGEELRAAAAESDLVINATPLGMQGFGTDFEELDFLDYLPKDALVCDLVYIPRKTKLLAAAQKRGYATLGGMDMLIYQAILAEALFFDKEPDAERLYKVAAALLQDEKEMAV